MAKHHAPRFLQLVLDAKERVRELTVDQVKAKMVQPELGVRIGTLIANGQAEIGAQQIGELLPIPGIDYVGPLPAELQAVIVYSAARSMLSASMREHSAMTAEARAIGLVR